MGISHSFDVDIATEYGVNSAILLQNIYFWYQKNKANDVHFYDGKYWTYNSANAFNDSFPYMGNKAIRNALKTLIDNGIIETAHYSHGIHGRTTWYTVTEKGLNLLSKGQNSSAERAKVICPKGETITDIKQTDINTDIIYTAESKQVASAPAVINIILNDGTSYGVTQNDVDAYKGFYPAIDVEAELKKAAAWCYSNPKNRKTRKGIARYINSWLSRAQDRAPKVEEKKRGEWDDFI